LLAGNLGDLAWYFRDEGIIHRLIEDDVRHQILGFDTCARFGYLVRLAGGNEHSGGYDCAHVFDLLMAIAVRDAKLVDRFVATFPGPFKSGHPATVILANGVYAVLQREANSYESLATAMRSRSEAKWFQSMLNCIAAIMAGDRLAVADAILGLAKGNKSPSKSSMQKLVCIEAHGLYQLCSTEFNCRGIAMPSPPQYPTWDAPFHEAVSCFSPLDNRPHFDFSAVNPILAKWIETLPNQVNVDDLLAHVG
jgi:hypothetical protein